ncbi:hypothetical protein D3C80_1195920 [compost metagenome]
MVRSYRASHESQGNRGHGPLLRDGSDHGHIQANPRRSHRLAGDDQPADAARADGAEDGFRRRFQGLPPADRRRRHLALFDGRPALPARDAVPPCGLSALPPPRAQARLGGRSVPRIPDGHQLPHRRHDHLDGLPLGNQGGHRLRLSHHRGVLHRRDVRRGADQAAVAKTQPARACAARLRAHSRHRQARRPGLRLPRHLPAPAG